MKLNLGCGFEKKTDYINVDISKEVNPDIVANVEKLPFKDNSTDEVFCKYVIEHLDNPITFLEECFRVLKNNGTLEIWTNHVSQFDSDGELAHKRLGLSCNSFVFCSPHNKRNYYGKLCFTVERIQIITHPILQQLADLSAFKYEKFLSRFFGAREIRFVLKCIK